MWHSAGPSLQLALLTLETVDELTVRGLTWLWEQCNGLHRSERRLARIEKQGLVQVTTGADALARVVRLTESGRLAALGGRDPEQEWSRPWDGKWRMVLFDVPERDEALRTRLRRRLRARHFGYLQNSAWISPDRMESLRSVLVGQKPDVETLSMLEAQPWGGESNQDLVTGAWDFDRLKRMYTAYFEVLRHHPSGGLDTAARRDAWRRWLQREWQAWQLVIRRDPLLPEALLPAGYLGREAWRQRMEILRSLPLTGAAMD